MSNTQNKLDEQLTETVVPSEANNNLGGDFPQVFYDLIKGRTDVVALAGSMSTKVKSEEEILRHVNKHLDGVCRLGIYNQFSDSTSPWAMVEFENHGKNRPELHSQQCFG